MNVERLNVRLKNTERKRFCRENKGEKLMLDVEHEKHQRTLFALSIRIVASGERSKL
jgi:hypothetical protein